MRPNQHQRGESYINKDIVISTFMWYNRLAGRSVDRSCRMVGRSGGYVGLAGWLVGRQAGGSVGLIPVNKTAIHHSFSIFWTND